MVTSPNTRTYSAALVLASLCLCLLAPPAIAGAPATVTVRVEGLAETKLPSTQVTTATAPVVKDGNSEHACPGTTAAGALQLATSANWGGPWNSEFKQYEIFTIEGETHLFEPEASANYYWSLWIDEKESFSGACEAELAAGDRVLLFPACYGSACPPNPALPLAIEAPISANVGEPVSVTVKKYGSGGEATPAAGATITGGAAAVTSDGAGHATVTLSSPGTITLRASAPEAVRTEANVCVHNGNDGNCGTTAPAGTTATTTVSAIAPPPYKGPNALVADVTGSLDGHTYTRHSAPRLIAGTIAAHTAVTSVSAELRRRYRGRCSTYDGARERFRSARCGSGSFFKVATGGVFSYLLPSALAPGRYVLDIEATDAAGNVTTLARGTSRLVFYVR